MILNYCVDFPNNFDFRGTICRVDYIVSDIPHVPCSVPQHYNESVPYLSRFYVLRDFRWRRWISVQ